MGMSTHVIGFRPPDERWQQMKAVWDSCQAAGLPVPKEVTEFFGWGDPDSAGVEVDLFSFKPCAREWRDETREGFEVDVAALPPDVKIIRFYNSW